MFHFILKLKAILLEMIHHILHKTEPVYENSFAAACFLQLAQEHRNFHQNFKWEGLTAPHFFQISPWLPVLTSTAPILTGQL
ncbi:hypothetical protein NC653_022505 [Populus alba x Populus x berolinensis]|uniref:Uncharacterized protein n=1 Tax=Populus alba x Populus x berolinensis TaxID=444605 RepID=A0AAD6MF19_9ROSI|nr:hypothetical protein NC653_022505 [Populus alba x Populus x berolinensis]